MLSNGKFGVGMAEAWAVVDISGCCPGSETLPAGVLKKRVLESGAGEPIGKGKNVEVLYEGRLGSASGDMFDSSASNGGDPLQFVVGAGRVIAAWDAVLATMLVGESCEMITSAGYAYGEAGAGDGLIPSGAALWFRIELLGARIPQDNPSGGRAAEARTALKEKAEKEAAQAAAREAAAAEAEEALAAEVVEALDALHVTPEPKQLKDTLMLMQTVASEEFLQAHKIAGLSGNKLAKIKFSDFKAIYEDFNAQATSEEKTAYACATLGRPAPTSKKADKSSKKDSKDKKDKKDKKMKKESKK